MTRILLVQDDPHFHDVLTHHLKSSTVDKWEYAPTGKVAAKMIAGGRFDIALISATLPDTSGVGLAKLAVNENIPVLMISGSPAISKELKRLDYQYLEKPFSVRVLLSESRRIALENARNLDTVRSSVMTLQGNLLALRAEIEASNRLFDIIVAKLGYLKP